MTAETFFQLFNQYGLILVCAVVFCEYMNLPGFPAGVIMPCVGVLIARSELSLPLTVFLSVIAGVLGSLVIYAVCYWGGEPVMEKLFGRSKKFKSLVRKCHEFIDAQHGRGLAIIRVIPCIRTIVSIPAGLLRMPVKWFVGWSAAGIAVWNTALISFGLFLQARKSSAWSCNRIYRQGKSSDLPVLCSSVGKWVHPFCKLHLQSCYGKIYTVI